MADTPSRQDRFAEISRQRSAGLDEAQKIRDEGDVAIALKRADLGWLGRFFGSKENAPTYIAAVFGAVCLVYIILSSAFISDHEPAAIRSFIGPVLIAVVGFLFGRGSRG